MYRLNLNIEESFQVLTALDLYSRIWIGQYDQILSDLRWVKSCRQLDAIEKELREKLLEMRSITLPELRNYGLSGSYGIFSPNRDVRAAIAYNMQQEFRNRRAWFLHPEGGYSVDFRKPLPCDDDPCEFPCTECLEENGEFVLRTDVEDRQLCAIIDALNVYVLEHTGRLDDMFRYFTDNKDALAIAEYLTKKLKTVETKYAFDEKPDLALIQKLEDLKIVDKDMLAITEYLAKQLSMAEIERDSGDDLHSELLKKLDGIRKEEN